MAYPEESDLTTYLATLGITSVAGYALDDMIMSAIREFEARTGRLKLQGDADASNVRYTITGPTGKYVLLEIFDTYDVDDVYTGWNGSTGTQLTEDTDYILLPENASILGVPVEAIRFLTYPTTTPRSIKVGGKLGYAAELPQDVFDAILARASVIFLTQQAGTKGQVASKKQGDRAISYVQASGESSSGIPGDTLNRLENQWERCISRYIRIRYQ